MTASQLIYTACDKERGDFCVFSKSADVTAEEEIEIVRATVYDKAAVNGKLSDEQIKKLPRQTVCFRLSSGRTCIAQSTFVGKAYSDKGRKTDNYFVHALIAEAIENPVAMIGNEIFREGLHESEWKGEFPATLPPVELMKKCFLPLSWEEITGFLSGGREALLPSLLQATINVISTGNGTVTFCDTPENEILWYKTLAFFLPPDLRANMTFNTSYNPRQWRNTDERQYKLRNVKNTLISAIYSYPSEIAAGRYAFDFLGGRHATVPVGRYVSDVTSGIFGDYAGVVNEIKSVGEFTSEHGVYLGVDLASDVYHIINGDFEKFSSAETLAAAQETADKAHLLNREKYAEALYRTIIQPDVFGKGEGAIAINRFAYRVGDNNVRAAIFNDYLAHHEEYGARTSLGNKAFTTLFRERAPFEDIDFERYLLNGECWRSIIAGRPCSDPYIYLVFDTFANALTRRLQGDEERGVCKALFSICADAFMTRSVAEARPFLTRIGVLGNEYVDWLAEGACSYASNGAGYVNALGVSFLFSVIEEGGVDAFRLKLFRIILKECPPEELAKEFAIRRAARPKLYQDLTRQLEGDNLLLSVQEVADIADFARTPTVSEPSLRRFYQAYCSRGKGIKVFSERFAVYARDIDAKTALAAYSEWLSDLDGEGVDLALQAVERAVYRDIREARTLFAFPQNREKIETISRRLGKSGFSPNPVYCVMETGETLTVPSNRTDLWDSIGAALENGTLFSMLTTEEQKAIFVGEYTSALMNAYLRLVNWENFDRIFEQVFSPFKTTEALVPEICSTLRKSDRRDSQTFVCYFAAYVTKYSGSFANLMRTAFERDYLTQLGGGDRKQLSSVALSFVPVEYRSAVVEYLNSKKAGGGFFGRIFGSLFGRGDDKRR